ncbi:MAG TPA: glycosyltransferase family 4 protein [Luteimonas sp.]|nr:glycosyltransferase family 4 protein [Luteimonas sp.]
MALTTSYPLRPGSASGIFVHRLYRSFPRDWRIDVLCPDDAAGTGSYSDGRVRISPVCYAPKRMRTLSQAAGGISAALATSPAKAWMVPLLILAMFVRCLREARSSDMIHANWAICGAIAALAARLARKPVATTLRGDDVASAKKSVFSRWVLGAAVGGSDAVVCVSDAMLEELKQLYPRSAQKMSVCRNGVDEDYLRVRSSAGDPAVLRVLAVGSAIRRKGFDVLISAMGAIGRAPILSVKIVGDGPEREELAARAEKLGVDSRLVFSGAVPPQEVLELLADADVFVLTSRSEGRPNVVLEALAAGVPVISTDLPGVRGLVEHGVNGWLFPVDDYEALAKNLREASDNRELLRAMGRNARARILASGETWPVAANRYAALFGTLMSRNATGAR